MRSMRAIGGAAVLLSACAQPAYCRLSYPKPRLTIALLSGSGNQAGLRLMARKAGSDLRIVIWPGTPAALDDARQRHRWDIVEAGGPDLLTGCADGAFARIDPAQLGAAPAHSTRALSSCGVGAAWQTLALAWNRQTLPGEPQWSDFWDVARLPGKRGLQRGARGNLEIALLADGVPPHQVYSLLSTQAGVDRAFHKLDQLRPYLVWWRTPADAVHLLTSGSALLTTAPTALVEQANLSHAARFGTQPDQALASLASWAIVAGTPHTEAAYRFLQEAADSLPPMVSGAMQIDEAFWHDHAAVLEGQFKQWLAH